MAYTQRQIMLSFAYLAYVDELLTTGTPSLDGQIGNDITSLMAADATTPIPPIAGDWTIVWGPATFTMPGALYQDNMMYVVQLNQPSGSTAPPQFAVAVRGTNGTVELDWLLEDFDVVQLMPWPIGATGTDVVGNISESTNIGLNILLNLQDPTTSATLQQFLTTTMANVTNTPASVCFTGHSLGGALASTLALYMLNNQSSWDPSSASIVTTITFAAPTQGDDDFAGYFNQQFGYTGTSPLSYWVPPSTTSPSYADCVRTSLDIVPLCWNTTTMGFIEGIYNDNLLFPPVGTSEIINYITTAINSNDYTAVEASQAKLTGPFVSPSDLPPGLNSNSWIAEAEYQHHWSYPNVLDVPSLLTAIPADMTLIFGRR